MSKQELHLAGLFILSLLPLPFVFGLIPCVYFDSELIAIEVFPKSIVVNCFYHYRNPWPVPIAQRLEFPVSTDRFHPNVNVQAHEQETGAKLAVRDSGTEKTMSVFFKPFEHKTVAARYIQACAVPNARYILLSTKAWGRPLQRGVYTLSEHRVKIAASNYPIQSSEGILHVFERRNFMPDKDWEFSWVPLP